MDLDWLKITTALLGLVGTGLGIYNLSRAKREDRQKAKHGYSLMLLSLDPIVDKLIELPLADPLTVHEVNTVQVSELVKEIDETLYEERKELVALTPEIAGSIVNLRQAARDLRRTLDGPTVAMADALRDITAYLEAAWNLAVFRQFAPDFEIKLNDQGKPNPSDWTRDPKVSLLIQRWEAFFKAATLTSNPSLERRPHEAGRLGPAAGAQAHSPLPGQGGLPRGSAQLER